MSNSPVSDHGKGGTRLKATWKGQSVSLRGAVRTLFAGGNKPLGRGKTDNLGKRGDTCWSEVLEEARMAWDP